MRMGIYNREITILRKEVTIDSQFGTEVVDWVPLSLLPGSPEVAERFSAEVVDVMPSRNENVLRTELTIARNFVRVRIRWRSDVDSTMRVVVHGDTDRTLEIIGGPSEVGGRKVALEMACEEIS